MHNFHSFFSLWKNKRKCEVLSFSPQIVISKAKVQMMKALLEEGQQWLQTPLGDLQPSCSSPPWPSWARMETGDRKKGDGKTKDCSCLASSHWHSPAPRRETGG